MSAYTTKIRVTENDIDRDILERTVRVFVTGDDRIWRTGIVKAVSAIIPKENILAIDKRGTFREWFVTVSSKNDVELLDIAGSYETERSKFSFSPSDKRRVEFRVHRAPRFLKNSVLAQVFEAHGRIISIIELVSSEPGAMDLKNGIRVVKMEMREDKMAAVPHFLESEDGAYKLLITSRDRAPLCLKCKCLGHVANNCNRYNIQDPSLYSSRVVNPIVNDMILSSDSDSNSEFSFREGEQVMSENDEEIINEKTDDGEKKDESNQSIEINTENENTCSKGENDEIIEAEAKLVEQMAFSDSWPEQVANEEKEKETKKVEREKAKRKAAMINEMSTNGGGGKVIKSKGKDKHK
ncbi:hypothetical protein SNE40_004299 [Patella caerulea]|uniref:CCHC-type domain-containing protein n=1 Tax=Patella caerulea TaxID=87958 RepID=A0AAN8K5F8_PATCE